MNQNFWKIKLTPKEQDYSQWYLDVAKNWEMFEYSPVPGCINFLPKAIEIREKVKEEINKKIKPMGVQNVSLPMLIPMSFFEKEKEHIEWFAPELAVVTVWGNKELDEKLAVRPTSETLFCEFFKHKLSSYRELPLLYNQWWNVMRWEKRTRPFLRTSEFHWQEGHTLHETVEEAYKFSRNIMENVYIEIFRNLFAIDWIAGCKPESEKFAGAEESFTFEPMMSNWWALQSCTAHVLDKWFMEQFEVSFQNREGEKAHPSYTSWGLSTRSIWAMISSHSDNKGLIIPPKLSQYTAVILPIYGKDNKDTVNSFVAKIAEKITQNNTPSPVKGEYYKKFAWEENEVLVDYRNVRIGEKITDFELSWYPIRIECGERDIQNNTCVVVSRITEEKQTVEIDQINDVIQKMLQTGRQKLFEKNKEMLKSNVIPCYTLDEIKNVVQNGQFAICEWDKDPEFENKIAEFKADIRCIPFKGQFTDELLELKDKNNVAVIVARAF